MREDEKHKIEVHVATICVRNNEVLVAKRSPSRELYPGLWECGGGQVKKDEGFEEAAKRQLKEEFGVVAEPVKVVDTYSIDTENHGKIPGVVYVCKFVEFVGNGPELSEEHAECRWQPTDGIDEVDFIPGIKENIEKAYSSIKG